MAVCRSTSINPLNVAPSCMTTAHEVSIPETSAVARELDPFGGRDVSGERPVNRDPRALDVGVHVALRRDKEGTLLHSDLALHSAMDRNVLPAGDFTGDEKRRSNRSHRINRPEKSVVPRRRTAAPTARGDTLVSAAGAEFCRGSPRRTRPMRIALFTCATDYPCLPKRLRLRQLLFDMASVCSCVMPLWARTNPVFTP